MAETTRAAILSIRPVKTALGWIVEGAGEDPRLGAVMAAARVRGFHGERLTDPTALLATPKHFAAYGAPEGGRDYNSAEISERTLWEVYLPPLRSGRARRWLLHDVLCERWGFTGVVVSDWNGVEELRADDEGRARAGRRSLRCDQHRTAAG